MDVVAYALAKKIAIGAVSGIDNISFQGTDLVFDFKDGTSASLNVPLPSDGEPGVSVTNLYIDEYNHLYCCLSDGTEIDAGEIEGGSGGTTNYNKLLNIPIENIEGDSSSPLVLEDLDYGMYNLTGYFHYTSADTVDRILPYTTLVKVKQDTQTSRKVASFETFEDNSFYVYNIYFNGDGTCLQDKVKVSNGMDFLEEASLPAQGEEGKLYITEDAIYQWRDGAYQSLTSQWSSF